MSIKRLPDGRFQHWYRDPDGRGHAKIFPTRREAADHEAEIRTAKNRGSYTDHRSGSLTLRKYAIERWLPYKAINKRPNTMDTYRSHLVTHVLPKIGSRKLGAIKSADCQELVAYLSIRLAPSTVFAVLHGVLKLAVKDGLLAANPATGTELPKVRQRVLERLEPGAVAALAAAITPRYEVAVWIAAFAGLREGEVLGLTLPRVEFLAHRIRVAEQMQNRVASPLKTDKSARVVPVDQMLLDKINGHLALWPTDGLLITNRLDAPVQRYSFGHCWRAAVKAAGLPKGTRFHDLRHFYAITLIEAGNLGPKTIQTRLGHATIGETYDTYGQWFRDDEEQGRGVIEAMFSEQVEGREAR